MKNIDVKSLIIGALFTSTICAAVISGCSTTPELIWNEEKSEGKDSNGVVRETRKPFHTRGFLDTRGMILISRFDENARLTSETVIRDGRPMEDRPDWFRREMKIFECKYHKNLSDENGKPLVIERVEYAHTLTTGLTARDVGYVKKNKRWGKIVYTYDSKGRLTGETRHRE
ncbi:MAG: hypothetical protein H8E27_02570 [Verrucomicrobia subdivision 3 bacterium]|nr:hypothetical protein [Limisphaerales bacterium]